MHEACLAWVSLEIFIEWMDRFIENGINYKTALVMRGKKRVGCEGRVPLADAMLGIFDQYPLVQQREGEWAF